MHQEVYFTIMFLQNKFHWEAFDHPECMRCSCNIKAYRFFGTEKGEVQVNEQHCIISYKFSNRVYCSISHRNVLNTSRAPPILGVNKVVPPVAPIEKQEHERECKSGNENHDCHES